MNKKPPTYATPKLWSSTYKILKILAAKTGETIVKLVDRLAKKEAAIIKKSEGKDSE